MAEGTHYSQRTVPVLLRSFFAAAAVAAVRLEEVFERELSTAVGFSLLLF
jgi:hypothetical protein